jgi:hypothetical protein
MQPMGSEGIWVPPGGSADPRPAQQEDQARQPTPHELAAELREQLTKTRISDVLVQTLYTVSSLGYHKLSQESRDLEQASVAIESMQALLPVLQGTVPDDVLRDFRQVVANMQFAYADAAADSAPQAEGEAAAQPGQETPPVSEEGVAQD